MIYFPLHEQTGECILLHRKLDFGVVDYLLMSFKINGKLEKLWNFNDFVLYKLSSLFRNILPNIPSGNKPRMASFSTIVFGKVSLAYKYSGST
jgi:hypothetical protein